MTIDTAALRSGQRDILQQLMLDLLVDDDSVTSTNAWSSERISQILSTPGGLASVLLSAITIDANKDWNNRSITNINSLSLNGGLSASVVSQSSAYELTRDDFIVLCDASTWDVVMALPRAPLVPGKLYNIKKVDSTAHTVIITADINDTIDGGATAVLENQYESVGLASDGSNWHVT